MTARLPRSSRSSRGFTLVELMAVVAITSQFSRVATIRNNEIVLGPSIIEVNPDE